MNSEHGFYNRYFKDYMEVPIEGGNGKFRRIYVGDYYRQELSKKQYIALRALYVLCFAVSAALFINAALSDWLSSFSLLVAVPTGACVVVLLLLLVALGFYVFAKRQMTVGEYSETSLMLKRYSLWSAVCLGVTAVCAVACALVYRVGGLGHELLNALKFLAAALPVLSIHLIERRIPYSKTPSGGKALDDGLQI